MSTKRKSPAIAGLFLFGEEKINKRNNQNIGAVFTAPI